MQQKNFFILKNIFVTALFSLLLVACGNHSASSISSSDSASISTGGVSVKNQKPEDLEPNGAKPGWGKDLTGPMAAVIEKLKSYNAPPIVSLSAVEARKQPSPADAAIAVLLEHKIIVPVNNTDTTGKDIAVPGGKIHLRIYTPKTGKYVYPVIVYYHGGGWVIADINTYNASAEALANLTEAVVVSVAYRQGPENKFPTAHNDCYAAYDWVVKNASTIKGTIKEIAVVGESAGGGLAAAVSMMARDKGIQMPVHEVLVYPIAGYDFTTASYKESDSIAPLNSGMM